MPQPPFFGPLPAVGTVAPVLRFAKADRHEGSLSDHKGEVVVLIAFPSVDTPTCAMETRTFNKRATEVGATVISISMDLPPALSRFCAAEGIDKVIPASDFRYRDAAHIWGAALMEGSLAGTLGRITWVIDREGVIRYMEVAPELGAEPDYEGALSAAKSLI